MPIRLNPDTDKAKLSILATQATIKYLSKIPTLLVNFLSDVVEGKHKDWKIYQIQYSNVVMEYCHGRPDPATKKQGGIPIRRTERQAKMYRNWGATFTPSLNLGKYHTPQEKIKAILSADCSPEIKAELLGAVKCS